ncbi:hypothetical protein DSECCO2_349320 [anaerobic digester metagenome]
MQHRGRRTGQFQPIQNQDDIGILRRVHHDLAISGFSGQKIGARLADGQNFVGGLSAFAADRDLIPEPDFCGGSFIHRRLQIF